MASPALVPRPQTRKVLILAQDPAVLAGEPLFTEVDVPYETPMDGPCGYRVRVIDYDTSTGKLYKATNLLEKLPEKVEDLLEDPAFHAQNVYAIVMRTLARFEFALGRRVNWSFDGHQIFLAPHAFADANAFYAKQQRGIFFGYFTGASKKTIFTCLSHDVIAHETTHALLDGLRERFTDPSSPQQGGLHEGLGDIVALLSIFSLQKVVERCLDLTANNSNGNKKLVSKKWLTTDQLKDSVLLGLGEEMGQEMAIPGAEINRRTAALRRSVSLLPDVDILKRREFQEPHRCGEVLVAAMMNAFLNIWCARIAQLGTVEKDKVDRSRVAEDGRVAAEHLLTIAIRAIDYTPPTDICYSDYLSALLTADYEVQPNDEQYGYRDILMKSFAEYGIEPSSKWKSCLWEPPDAVLDYSLTHFESMQRDRDEIFRFMWENREELGINTDAYTRVMSIRPCTRVSSDGFTLRESIGEYVQMITVQARELPGLKWEISDSLPEARKKQLKPFPIPKGMPENKEITLYGGGTLIFDEYGRLKYHVRNKILNADRQASRLQFLWGSGFFDQREVSALHFANLHRLRWTDDPVYSSSKEVHHDEYF